MSEYYSSPTPTEQDRLTEDELVRLQHELQIGVNNSLDDAETIAMLGFGGRETPSIEQFEAKETEPSSPEWTRRGMGAFALMNLAEVDVSRLYLAANHQAEIDREKAALGYANHYELAA